MAIEYSEIEIMVYNVENLFDARHDVEAGVDKNDWTFLPMKTPGKKEACKKSSYWRYKKECFNTDWNQKLVDLKISQIKKVILSERKKLPTILALVEIENRNVIAMLAKALGYKEFKVSQSPDKRGIDLALLYNATESLKFVNKNEIEIKGDYFKKKPTRVILEVEFLINKKPVHIFVNHWPSQGNPSIARITAAQALRKRIKSIDEKHFIMAVGDFNTIPSDLPHPFHNVLLEEELLTDVHTVFSKDRSIDGKIKESMPPGTYFYSKTMSWNILDRIFLSKNLMDGKNFDAILNSYQIYAPHFITSIYEYKKKSSYLSGSKVMRVPMRYNHSELRSEKVGYSDHFPVLLRFKL